MRHLFELVSRYLLHVLNVITQNLQFYLSVLTAAQINLRLFTILKKSIVGQCIQRMGDSYAVSLLNSRGLLASQELIEDFSSKFSICLGGQHLETPTLYL